MLFLPKAPKRRKEKAPDRPSFKKTGKNKSSKSGGHKKGGRSHGGGGSGRGNGGDDDGAGGGSGSGAYVHEEAKGVLSKCIHIYLAMYKPQEGNFYHWALAAWSDKKETWYVLRVMLDEQAAFTRSLTKADPRGASSFRGLIPLFDIPDNADNRHTVRHLGDDVAVPGEAALWNCQDYVMEMMEQLCILGLVCADVFEGAKNSIMKYYGPGAEEGEEDEVEEEEVEEPQKEYKSAEFVLDSSSSEEDLGHGKTSQNT